MILKESNELMNFDNESENIENQYENFEGLNNKIN